MNALVYSYPRQRVFMFSIDSSQTLSMYNTIQLNLSNA
jgi:hypothetical protein